MYVAQQHYVDPALALRHAAAAGAGELVTISDGRIEATRVPFLMRRADGSVVMPGDDAPLTVASEDSPVDDPDSLVGIAVETHLNRVNTQWRDTGALLIVTCADTFVSVDDMPPPARAGASRFPTWNYLTVHVRGEIIAHDKDDEWNRRHVRDIAARFERQWRVDDASQEAADRILPALVGVELRVTEVVGKGKLSQGLSSSDLSSTIDALNARGTEGANEVADLMRDIAVPYVLEREARVDDALKLKGRPRHG